MVSLRAIISGGVGPSEARRSEEEVSNVNVVEEAYGEDWDLHEVMLADGANECGLPEIFP